MLKKFLLVLLLCAVVAGISYAEVGYISIKHVGNHYVVTPATLQQYQDAVASQATDVWIYSTEKPVNELAQAGVFGSYATLEAATGAIVTADVTAKSAWINALR